MEPLPQSNCGYLVHSKKSSIINASLSTKIRSNAKIFRGSVLPKKKQFIPNIKSLLVEAFNIGRIEFSSPLNFVNLSNGESEKLVDELYNILQRKETSKKPEKYFLENCVKGRKLGFDKNDIRERIMGVVNYARERDEESVCERLIDFYERLGVFRKIGVNEDKHFEGVKVGFSNLGDLVREGDLDPIELERYV